MSFSVGIIGLPNTGKSTLFKALTKKQVDIADYPFTTIKPNVGVVAVPDGRLKKIAQVIKPQKTTETFIKFVDIAGLVKGAHKGQGLGNQFLSYIRNCDAVVEVVRAFTDRGIEGEVNPAEDIETIKTELLMKDLETIEGAIDKLKKNKEDTKKLEVLKKIQSVLNQEKLISDIDLTEEEKSEIKEYQFLTAKPIIYILNFNRKERGSSQSKEKFIAAIQKLPKEALLIDLKFEEELSEFSEEEARQLRSGFASPLESVVYSCYNILDLITFFTIKGGKETRAWTLKRGSDALEAAAKVHSDFKEQFIRAEVIPWQKLVEAGSWSKAKELGLIKTVGKDYLVQNGDIIEFKI